MDDIVNHAIAIADSDTSNDIDKCFEVNIKNMNNVPHQEDVINFSTLDFDRLKIILSSNAKLLNDFFGFSLYRTLVKETQLKVFADFKISYKYIQNAILFCFDEQDLDLLDLIIENNKDILLEPEIVLLLNSILNEDIQSFKYSGAIDSSLKETFIAKIFTSIEV
jgi:hypothetical protein